jgi:subtilisin family serine protease
VLIYEGPDDPEVVARAYAADPAVDWAEPDARFEAFRVPNDPDYSALWALPKINAPEAWDASTGGGVVVAVVDSGVDGAHPDLASRMWSNPGEIPGNGLDDDGNGFVDDAGGWRPRKEKFWSNAGARRCDGCNVNLLLDRDGGGCFGRIAPPAADVGGVDRQYNFFLHRTRFSKKAKSVTVTFLVLISPFGLNDHPVEIDKNIGPVRQKLHLDFCRPNRIRK